MLRQSCSTGKALFNSPLVPSSDSTARAGSAAEDRSLDPVRRRHGDESVFRAASVRFLPVSSCDESCNPDRRSVPSIRARTRDIFDLRWRIVGAKLSAPGAAKRLSYAARLGPSRPSQTR